MGEVAAAFFAADGEGRLMRPLDVIAQD